MYFSLSFNKVSLTPSETCSNPALMFSTVSPSLVFAFSLKSVALSFISDAVAAPLADAAFIFSDASSEVRIHDHATHPAVLKFDLLFDNPFVHSSVMFRKKDSDRIGGYNTDRSFFEDFELWSRFSRQGPVANLKEVLVEYRHHDQGLSKTTGYFKEDARYAQTLRNIEALMGKENTLYNELAALFHWDTAKLNGFSKQELFGALTDIANKIKESYPDDKPLVEARLEQYKKIIAYRLNINARRKFAGNFFKILRLKIENKLSKLHPHVIND